jgi:hypothetical protein
MDYLKVDRKKSGSNRRILESYRNDSGKPTSRVLYSLGKLEDYTYGQLKTMDIKLFEFGAGQVKSLLTGDIRELGRYNYGYQQIFG